MSLLSTKAKHASIYDTSKKKKTALEKLYDGSDILSRHRQRTNDDKCSIKEFTNKRREMLMLNMSINTQQEEIDKLHADLEKKEGRIQKRQAELDENMKRFDNFLKEMYQKRIVASALEEQLRTKADREQVVKELSQQIHIVEASMRQHTDTIELNEASKRLSQVLAPPEWFCEVTNEKRSRQRERRRQRIEKRKDEYLQQQKEANKKRQGPRRPSKIEQETPEPDFTDFEDDPLTSSDEECPPYFEDTEQLDKAIKIMEEEKCSIEKKLQELTLHEFQLHNTPSEND